MRVVTKRGDKQTHGRTRKKHARSTECDLLTFLNINNKHGHVLPATWEARVEAKSNRLRGSEFRSELLHKWLLREASGARPAYMADIRGEAVRRVGASGAHTLAAPP